MINIISLIDKFNNSTFWIIQDGTIKNLFGFILMIWGYIDAIKYRDQTCKIRQVNTARGNSRKFINKAIGNDLFRLFYFFFVDRNFYVLITSILALICMIELWFTIYWFYPYKCRGLNGFKRPNIMLYFINSALPNRIRKRL
jgi:hypothetical protein